MSPLCHCRLLILPGIFCVPLTSLHFTPAHSTFTSTSTSTSNGLATGHKRAWIDGWLQLHGACVFAIFKGTRCLASWEKGGEWGRDWWRGHLRRGSPVDWSCPTRWNAYRSVPRFRFRFRAYESFVNCSKRNANCFGPLSPSLSLSHSLLLSPSHIRVWSVNHMGAPIYLHTCPRPLYHMYIDIPAKCDYTIGNMANYSH